jgi:U5 small nuclear ribonucleoprotein component
MHYILFLLINNFQCRPSPSAAAKGKVARCYTGPLDAPFVGDMVACRAAKAQKLIMHVTKLYSSSDGRSFDALARIYSGTCKPGQRVRVLGEGYVPNEDDEDTAMATIESISIPRGRSQTKVTLATAGNWVLLKGVDATIAKTATIVGKNAITVNDGDETAGGDGEDEDEEYPVHIFAPLKFPFAGGESTMKLALEPLNPAELPKMVQGLRSVSKAYPMVKTRVEESGEHVLYGTGELYMDCVLHDLRHVYGDVEVKVADPSVALRETVIETSSLKCFAETTNRKNKLTFIAEPMDDGLAERLESGTVNIKEWDQRKVGRFFQTQYGWDLLSSRSVWAFGDSPTRGTNLLLDDTLPSEVNKKLLDSSRASIVQGFQWATREGPLCEEPVRGTKLKILEVDLADKMIHRGGGQIIPTARKTVHSALLTATPRLMEPIYRVQIQCPSEMVSVIQPLLKRRRGHIVRDVPISGTLLYSVRGFIPVLDSFGFETDLRTYTQGQAMVHAVFDHWAVCPGDPLDKNLLLHPLEPSPPHLLARELLLKTRRRKGLSEDVSIDKFFDSAMKEQMAASKLDEGALGKLLVEEMEEGEEMSD